MRYLWQMFASPMAQCGDAYLGAVVVWAPNESNRTAIKFWLDCLQVLTIIAGVASAVGTFIYHSIDERNRAVEQANRAQEHAREQAKQEQEHMKNARMELQRPYLEKQLNLYLDTARVLAHLASSPSVDKEKTEARFWELYWGELAFVESLTKDEKTGGPVSVERLMVRFCRTYFSNDQCASSNNPPQSPPGSVNAAIEMSRGASKEVHDQWDHLAR
jgi:type II secretory pathway pseudopilin PulG